MGSKKQVNSAGERTSERFQQPLPCKLSEEEIAAKAQAMAEVHANVQALEQAKKDSASTFADQIKAEERRMSELVEQVKTRSEIRGVECVERHDLRLGQVDVVRMDSGEVVESRPMTEDERQGTLFNGDAHP